MQMIKEMLNIKTWFLLLISYAKNFNDFNAQ